MVFVGNDVVDLADPRTEGRATDERFVGRVFDADEQAAIRAGTSDLELWSRWAAKEAGYKAISKALGEPPPFVHRAFKVAWSREDALAREGTVEHLGHRAHVSVVVRDGAVHAVAHLSGPGTSRLVRVEPRVVPVESPGASWSGPLEDLKRKLTELEADAVYSRESAAVRIGAREDLARLLGVATSRLEIVCAPIPGTAKTGARRPPRVLLDGDDAPADVSLSHDGRWIAWAIWVDS